MLLCLLDSVYLKPGLVQQEIPYYCLTQGVPHGLLLDLPHGVPHNFQLGLPLGPPLYCLHSTQSPTLSHTGSSITLSPTRSPTQSTTRSTIRSPTWSPIQTQFPVSTRPPMNSRICSLAQTPIWSHLQGFPVTPFPTRSPTCSFPTHSSTWEPTPRFTPCWNTSLLHSGQLFNTRVAWYLSTVIGQGFKNHLQDILRIYILLIKRSCQTSEMYWFCVGNLTTLPLRSQICDHFLNKLLLG